MKAAAMFSALDKLLVWSTTDSEVMLALTS